MSAPGYRGDMQKCLPGCGGTTGEQGGGSLLKAKLGNPAPGVHILWWQFRKHDTTRHTNTHTELWLGNYIEPLRTGGYTTRTVRGSVGWEKLLCISDFWILFLYRNLGLSQPFEGKFRQDNFLLHLLNPIVQILPRPSYITKSMPFKRLKPRAFIRVGLCHCSELQNNRPKANICIF